MSDLGLISYRAYWKVRLEVLEVPDGLELQYWKYSKCLKGGSEVDLETIYSKDILLYYLCNYPEKEISVKAISEEMGEFLDHKDTM